MRLRSTWDLHETYEELHRLLSFSQAPSIEILMRARFLRATIAFEGAAWTAYGFPVMRDLLPTLKESTLHYLPGEDLEFLAKALQGALDRRVPEALAGANWGEGLERARSRIARALEAADRSLDAKLLEGVETLASRPSESATSIGIPVVASIRDAGIPHPIFAGLRSSFLVSMSVHVEAAGAGFRDGAVSLEGPAAAETRAALSEAARQVDRLRIRGAPKAPQCIYRVRWEPATVRLAGRSATLGFALAAACGRSSLGLGITERILPRGAAATGDLVGLQVRAVDEKTLSEKVQACDRGSIRHLLVPSAQASAAREALALAHPGGTRPVMEVTSASDVLSAWRAGPTGFVRTRRRTARNSLARVIDRLTRGRARFIAATGAAALGVAILTTWWFLRAAPPISAGWEGDTLVLKNKHGLTTGSLSLPYAPGLSRDRSNPPEWITRLVESGGQGRTTLVAIHGSVPHLHDLLTAADLDGHVLWRRRANEIIQVAAGMPSDMFWRFLALDEGPSGKAQVLALSRSRQGNLSLLAQIEPGTGEVLGLLRSTGHLERFDAIRLSSDDRVLLAYSGTDNPTGRGICVFVDPDSMGLPARLEGVASVPLVSDPGARSWGVVGAISVVLDRFSRFSRASCWRVTSLAEGALQVETLCFEQDLAVIYEIDATDLQAPILRRAYFCDAVKEAIRENLGEVPDEDFVRETARLAREVRFLTSGGWRPIALGEGVLLTAVPPVTSPSVRGGPFHRG